MKTKKKYAVKRLDQKALNSMRLGNTNITASDCCREELKVLKKLQHPNLIWLHEVIDDPDGALYLVTEYYPNSSLGEEMRRLNV